jgi:hypothetical protein
MHQEWYDAHDGWITAGKRIARHYWTLIYRARIALFKSLYKHVSIFLLKNKVNSPNLHNLRQRCSSSVKGLTPAPKLTLIKFKHPIHHQHA